MALIAYAPDAGPGRQENHGEHRRRRDCQKPRRDRHSRSWPTWPPSSAVCSGARDVQGKDRTAWTDRCRGWRTRYPFVRPEHLARQDAISLYAFSKSLRRIGRRRRRASRRGGLHGAKSFSPPSKPKRASGSSITRAPARWASRQPSAIGDALPQAENERYASTATAAFK